MVGNVFGLMVNSVYGVQQATVLGGWITIAFPCIMVQPLTNGEEIHIINPVFLLMAVSGVTCPAHAVHVSAVRRTWVITGSSVVAGYGPRSRRWVQVPGVFSPVSPRST